MMKNLLILTLVFFVCFAFGVHAERVQNCKEQIARARRLYADGEQAKCLLITNRIVDTYNGLKDKTHDDSLNLMKAEYFCGNANISLGNVTRGMKLLKLASDDAKKLGDTKFLAQTYNSLFYVYYNSLDFDQALDLLSQAIELSAKSNDKKNLIRLYNNKGLVLYAEKKYSEALDCMRKALSLTAADEKIERAQVYTNMAEVYYSQAKYAETESLLAKAIAELDGKRISTKTLQTYLNMALVKARLGKKTETKEIQHRINGILPMLPLPLKVNSLRQMADIDFVVGDSVQGLRYMLEYDQYADSLQKIDNNSQMRQLLVAYDTERLAQHNEALRRSLQTRTILVYGSLAFLLVVIVFSIMLWIKFRENKLKGALIAEQKEQLLRYEQQEHERQQKKMRLELDHKSRQLTSYTIDLAAVNEFHQKIEAELDRLLASDDCGIDRDRKETVRRIKDMLAHFNDKPVNDDFRIFFEEVHPEYLKKLSRCFPKLSENDLRLCAYIFLGMSTKEIAALTYHEVRSIESSRNRLRKKLDLEAGADVKAFLVQQEDHFNNMQ